MTTVAVSTELLDDIQDEISWFLEHADKLKWLAHAKSEYSLETTLKVKFAALRRLRVAIREQQDPQAPCDLELSLDTKAHSEADHTVLVDGVKIGSVRGSRSGPDLFHAYPTEGRELSHFKGVTFDQAVALVATHWHQQQVDQARLVLVDPSGDTATDRVGLPALKAAGQHGYQVGEAIREWTNLIKTATGRRATLPEAAAAFRLGTGTVLALVPSTIFAVPRAKPPVPTRTITIEIENDTDQLIVLKSRVPVDQAA